MTTIENTLTGRTAVVTGAGTGIGAATARTLAARGARVALLGRRPERIQAVADEIGGLAVAADVSDPAALEAALATVRDRLGTPDLVVANAGAMLAAPFADGAHDEWRRMLDVNVMGLLDTARLTSGGLLAAADEGRTADLVLISSIGAHLVIPGYAVYTATKAAVTHLANGLHAELGPRGVRVHSVEPGMTQSDLGHDMASAEAREWLVGFKDLNPPIPAEAIADAVAWSTSLPREVNVLSVVVQPTAQV